jgi:hypothetical protein
MGFFSSHLCHRSVLYGVFAVEPSQAASTEQVNGYYLLAYLVAEITAAMNDGP